MPRRRTYGASFSWKRALGVSAAKGRLSRKIGIPLTKSGRDRKVGRMAGPAILVAFVVGVAIASNSSSNNQTTEAPKNAALVVSTDVDPQPSFDCTKARTSIEKTICADPELVRLDARMGQLFKRESVRLDRDKRQRLLEDQRFWAQSRAEGCRLSDSISTKQCLLQMTKARIAQLEKAAMQ